MFERYTENARRTIFFARWEANQCGASSIEPEHVLLSLLRDNWLKNSFLENLSETEFRSAIVTKASASAPKQTADIPLSDTSKRILSYSAEEADRLLDSHIGTEHLLLAVLREKRCDAAHALNTRGLKIKDLRKLMRQIPREERKLKGTQ
jgi:ATP-dependent Clp protease ATP-binding subunit ClpC